MSENEIDNGSATEVANSTKANASEGGTSKNREEVLANQLDEAISKNAKYRQANSEYKARLAELETQAQRAAELEEQVSKLSLSHRQELAMAKLEALANREGLVDPDDLKLIDLSAVKYDADGRPENLAEVMSSFKEAKPHKFGSVATSSVEKAPKPAKTDSSTAAKEMSDTEFKQWMKAKGVN